MTMKAATEHPCFGGDHSKTGRIHLPVAAECNIKGGFCERRFDCANESRPGVTSRVLPPEQALERVRLVTLHMERQGEAQLKVVGIAGPGDPLANPRTFETFRLIREKLPKMTRCLSTNGLRLAEMIGTLKELGLHSLTVTVNALAPRPAQKSMSGSGSTAAGSKEPPRRGWWGRTSISTGWPTGPRDCQERSDDMTAELLPLLAVSIFVVAMLYASVGHGGLQAASRSWPCSACSWCPTMRCCSPGWPCSAGPSGPSTAAGICRLPPSSRHWWSCW